MKLTELLRDLNDLSNQIGSNDTKITGITTDPNLCRPGFLYLAAECESVDSTRLGLRLDGRHFISLAVRNGASVVLTDLPALLISSKDNPEQLGQASIDADELQHVTIISHHQPLELLGLLCSRFYGRNVPESIALVTGTNGKTSTVNFCRALWSALDLPSCSIGNLGGVCSDGSIVWDRDPVLSVPETVTLHTILNTVAARGFNHVAMEATSHALFDYRLSGVPAKIGAFTNLTHDHLDFHHTMDEYFRVKMTLFTHVLPSGSFAVLNADSDWFPRAEAICKDKHHQLIRYGVNGTEIRLLNSEQSVKGHRLGLDVYGKKYEHELNLFGEFQISNALCALAVVIASGVDPSKAVEQLSTLGEIEGRLNTVAITASGGRVVVDYAHSPDAIRAALQACRIFTPGKLLIVFGCIGERDAAKRAPMGEIASMFADEVIVTDGHPRKEDAATIRRAVLAGAPEAKEIADRAEAIEYAIGALSDGDTLLIAGLGHENFRTVGEVRHPYSDSETARRIVELLKSGKTSENLENSI